MLLQRDTNKSIGHIAFYSGQKKKKKKRPKVLENWSFKTAALVLPKELLHGEQKTDCPMKITGTSSGQGRGIVNNFHLPVTLLHITVAHVQYIRDIK